jgi:hypothetical protein
MTSESYIGGVAAPLPLQWYAALHTFKPVPQLVKGLLAEGSLCVLFGESNSGKSFLILDVALAVAAGQLWCGQRTQRGLVVYVAGEGAASVRTRVAAYRRTHPELTSGLPFAIIPLAVDFRDATAVAALIATVRAAEAESGEKVALIVVDTFARCFPGGNENDAQDVGEVVAAADHIRAETGAALAFVHHAGKDPSKGARGSSALRAAADTELLVEGTSGTRTLTVTKQRDLEPAPPMGFDLETVELGTDEDGEPVTSCVVRYTDATPATKASSYALSKRQHQFVDAMRVRCEGKPEAMWSLTDLRRIGREVGLSKDTARSVVDRLVASPYFKTCAFGYQFSDGRVEG